MIDRVRESLGLVVAMVVLGVIIGVAGPYLDMFCADRASTRRRARDEVVHESESNAVHRAAFGAGLGLVVGVIGAFSRRRDDE